MHCPFLSSRSTLDSHAELWQLLSGATAEREPGLLGQGKWAKIDFIDCPASTSASNGDGILDPIRRPRSVHKDPFQILRTVIAHSVDH